MLDFAAVRARIITFDELTAGLTRADLVELTNEMVDAYLALIAGCGDADVTFEPVDPHAQDPYAASAAEANVAWTLGHVIVHSTASSEEAAFIAAEMARGVEPHGRSRYETPWMTVRTIAQCRKRLEESRRIRLATLETWPDEPHLEVVYQSGADKPRYDCIQRFVLGLRHEQNHLGQVAEIRSQSCAARAQSPLAGAVP
jgi:hypothetical protein